MHAYGHYLVNKQDEEKFKKNEETFTKYWSTRQPTFIEYYNSECRPTVGKTETNFKK